MLAVLVLLISTHAHAQKTGPATASDVEITEWLILLAQPGQPRANASADIQGVLPEALDPLRLPDSPAPFTQPCPIGNIRFTGPTDSKLTLRLSIPEDGVFYTSWPPAHTRFRNSEWPGLTLSASPQRLVPRDSLKWLSPLRDYDCPYLTVDGRSEKFLLYDAELPYRLPLALEPVNNDFDQLRVRNKGSTPLHDLVLYRPSSHGVWSTAHAETIDPAPKSTVATTQPTDPEPLAFASVGDNPAPQLTDDWTTRLKPLGLPTPDLDLIVATLKVYALDDSQTTAVYRLDESELNRVLSLQVTSRPKSVHRVALVVARNIDPDLPRILDRLIAQLGDRDWRKRELSSRTLARFGPVAAPRLRQALQNGDPEVALRAERLLARIAAR